MKKTFIILGVLLTGMWAQATLQMIYTLPTATFDSGNNPLTSNPLFGDSQHAIGTVEMANPVGQNFYGNVAAQPWERVVSAQVHLNISGDFNGTLYAYLISPSGTVGMTLIDPNANSGTASANLTGSGVDATFGNYQSDGSGGLQAVSGANSIVGYSDGGTTLSGNFQGVDSLLYQTWAGSLEATVLNAQGGGAVGVHPDGPYAQGVWTLFLADLSSPGAPGDPVTYMNLNSWSLSLTVVPEPVDMALGLFAAMLLACAGVKRFWTAKEAEVQPEV